MPRGGAALHAAFPLAGRPMRMRTPVRARATLAVVHPWPSRARGRAIALQCSGEDHPGDRRTACEERAEARRGGVRVPSTLHQHIEEVLVRLDGAPQRMPRTIDRQHDCLQVPRVPRW